MWNSILNKPLAPLIDVVHHVQFTETRLAVIVPQVQSTDLHNHLLESVHF